MLTVLTASDLVDGVLDQGAWAVDATPEEIHLTEAVVYRLAALAITKAPATGIALPAAKTINTGAAAGQFWGVFTIQSNAAGTVTALAPTDDQVHATEVAALAAQVAAAADNVVIGYLTIQSLTDTAWTSVTDSLTDDVAIANFSLPGLPPRLFRDPVQLRAIRWVGATDAAHTVELAQGGRVVWADIRGTDTSAKDDSKLAEKFPDALQNLDVWTLESGQIYVYHP